MKRIYRTMQGREIDMDQLIAKNETMPAIGNVRMNARGDELGPTGEIIRTKEEKISEYYDSGVVPIEQVKIKSNRTSFVDSKLEKKVEETSSTPIMKKETINDFKRKDLPSEG